MNNAFVTWAKQYIAHIDERLPWLESRRITLSESREGVRVDTTQEMIDDLLRQKAELVGLISAHNSANS